MVSKVTSSPVTHWLTIADATIEWHTAIPWMRSQTKLEIWLKGVASPEDVALAIQHKVDGIMISNHGKSYPVLLKHWVSKFEE